MRSTLLTGMMLFATYAAAQPAPDAGSQDQPPPYAQGQPPGAPLAPHPHGGAGFDAANTTRDGRLTRDQAQAGGRKPIVKHFDQIDADHKGYVTKQDIRAWRQARKAAKQARMQQGGQPGAYPPAGAPPAPDAAPPVGQEQPGPPPQ